MSFGNDTAVLSIAGSDPSGGAGIQADLKTFAALGCYGASVITAVTAQNTAGVQGVFPIPPDFVKQQLTSVLEDLPFRAIKTGMLHDADTIRTISKTLEELTVGKGSIIPLVCDPVCVSTSGHTLLQQSALSSLISDLFPISTLITPNKTEAELLLNHASGKDDRRIEGLEDMLQASADLLQLITSSTSEVNGRAKAAGVLLKGGHLTVSPSEVNQISENYKNIRIVKQHLLDDNMEILLVDAPGNDQLTLVVDVLAQGSGATTVFVRPRIETTSTHGTGCTLSSAIAANLAKGLGLEQAVDDATLYTHLGITGASANLGHGHGPLDHLHALSSAIVPRSSPTNKYPLTRILIESTRKSWQEYVQHDFVVQLGKGTLDKSKFIKFIKQDYIYLKYYARAYGLLASKSPSFPQIARANQTILNIIDEISNHKALCASFTGLSLSEIEADLESTREEPETTAYGAYLIDMGLQGDPSKLTMSLMACLLGYGEVGLWLKRNSVDTPTRKAWVVREGNPYDRWIEEYSGLGYQEAVKLGLRTIEDLAKDTPPSRSTFEDWRTVWERCTWLEKGFWDMAMRG